MRKFLICLAAIAVLTMVGGRAIAGPVYFGDGGAALQSVLDNITVAPIPNVSSIDVVNDAVNDNQDSHWSIHGSGGSVSTLIIELASWSDFNEFGVYDPADPSKMVQIFAGSATAGAQALLSILNDGSVIVNFADSGVDFASNSFGYFLDSEDGHPGWTGGIWRSNSALNVDGKDHMYAYLGKGTDTIQIPPFAPGIWDKDEYVLAFEDLHSMHWGNQDGDLDPGEWSDTEPDFTDFVVMVESVDPVPEPSFILLLGSLLIGLGLIEKRRYMK
jgi:hypothetical protein